MDPVIIGLAVLTLLALSGWGYGYTRPAPLAGGVGSARGRWVHPLGALGLFLAALIALLLVMGWRPVL
jgi:hypothetical protein